MEMSPRHLPQQEGQKLYINEERVNTIGLLPADDDESKAQHEMDMAATLPLHGLDISAALP